MGLFRKKKPSDLNSSDDTRLPLEKHDKLAMLIAAYGIFIPAAILALGTILLIVLLVFRVI